MNLKKDVLPLLQETWSEFQEDEVGHLGAALAYYAVFSIFPLLLLLLAVLGFVLSYWNEAIEAQAEILRAVSSTFSPQLAETLGSILEVVQENAGAATGVGLVTLLLGASGVFQQLDITFNKIWNIPKKEAPDGVVNKVRQVVSEKLFSFSMVLAVGFLLLVSMAVTGITEALLRNAGNILGYGEESRVAQAVGFGVGLLVVLGLNTLIFALLFKYLPDTDVRWKDVWVGALLTAVIWEVAKRLLAIYLGNSSYANAYGVVGGVLLLMAWIYFSSQVLFLGAEFTEVFSRRHGSRQQRPEPAATPMPALAPVAAPPVVADPSTGRVARATGAGLVVGVVGGALAAVAALLIGTRHAASTVTRRLRRQAR